jgi:hypothetical protein
MSQTHSSALTASRIALRILIVLNMLLGIAIVSLLVATLTAQTQVFTALGVEIVESRELAIQLMRMIMAIGIVAVALAHLILARLLAIVRTVASGDAFVAVNAERLRAIAWALLGLQLLEILVGAVAAGIRSQHVPLHIGWEPSVSGWLAVLLLFVLARIFNEGARMREDLEGTV